LAGLSRGWGGRGRARPPGRQASRVADAITQGGGRPLPLVAGVFDHAQLNQERDRVLDTWGAIDILLNAAGGICPEPSSLTTGRSSAWQ
jgi:NAD(P)-dependent dehydrogenase (short-subunit alcohol dehydrogenase family)